MNAQLAPSSEHPQHAQALLRTLVITDLCDSTALVERLGDQRTAELIRDHDRLLRGLIRRHRGQEVDKTDGFLSLFERPIQAVAFALDYQRDLQAFTRDHGVALKARIGIHVGEVMTWQNNSDDVADGAKPMEVEGLAKPIAARLMGLALPGQILLSSVAYTLAHRAEGELGATLSRLKWKHHGRFRFKGVVDAVPVYEIGEPDIAPFRSPAWTGKAHREVPLWRRPLSLALESLMLLALVALPLWHFLKPEPAIAFAERDWVVLGDLRNLTGDARFDDSLEQALRIGLEQSRHVNLVSDLKLQRTLELMLLDPRDTNVDRKVGSELAQRENAKLLILPTLAELGGRLRLTVEVVDPYSQVSVFSTSADALDSSTLVAGVDQTALALRRALGESMKGRPEGEVPLARATTSELDALRAYSLGVKARSEGRAADAEALFRSALEIDSDFALARVGIAEALRDQANRQGALAQLELALEHSNRLPVHERLITQANLHMLRGEGELAIRAWSTAAELYPDNFPAHGGLAWAQWMYGLNLAAGLRSAQVSASEANPFRGTGVYLRATLLLGSERYMDAEEAFKEARSLRSGAPLLYEVALHAAQRQWPSVDESLSRAESLSDGLTSQWYLLQLKAALAIDKGDWNGLLERSQELTTMSQQLGTRHRSGAAALALTTSALLEDQPSFLDALVSFRRNEVSADPTDPEAEIDRIFRYALAANLAASRGIHSEARDLLTGIESNPVINSSPALTSLFATTRARILSLSGENREAWALLERVPADREAHWLLSTRAVVAAAARRADFEQHLKASAYRRGLAYTENRSDRSLQAFGIAQGNLADLSLQAIGGEAAQRPGRTRWSRDALPVGVAEMLDVLMRSQADGKED